LVANLDKKRRCEQKPVYAQSVPVDIQTVVHSSHWALVLVSLPKMNIPGGDVDLDGLFYFPPGT
jgi:hypothetical protein